MKAAESYRLQVLDYKPVPARRRAAFISFMGRLKLVTSSVTDTAHMLTDSGNPRKPKSKSANKAMFQMLCSRVDSYLITQLHELQARLGREDGHAALMLLRTFFADAEDIDYTNAVLNQFRTIKLQDNESVFAFSKRFGNNYQAVTASGQSVPERERIRYYLRALREHREPRILFEVKDMLASLDRGEHMHLQDLKQRLIREESQVIGNFKETHFDQTITVRHGSRPQRRSRRHANMARGKSHKGKSAKPGGKPGPCWGCLSPDHTLRYCKTTSEGDKKRIYEMHSAKRQNYAKTKPSTTSSGPSTSTANKATASSPRQPLRSKQQSDSAVSFQRSGLANLKKSYANAAAKKERRIAVANAATVFKSRHRRRVFCMATLPSVPVEADIPDPFDMTPPPLDEGTVQRNPKAKIVYYEHFVLLDSGASDCMVYSLKYLDLIRSAYVTICLADGTIHDCDYQGLMRISVVNIDNNERVVVPMTDTLLVPGLRTILWSVSALTSQGHQVNFGFTTVSIMLHANTPNALEIRLRHPMLSHNGQEKHPFALTALAARLNNKQQPNRDSSQRTAETESDEDDDWSLVSGQSHPNEPDDNRSYDTDPDDQEDELEELSTISKIILGRQKSNLLDVDQYRSYDPRAVTGFEVYN